MPPPGWTLSEPDQADLIKADGPPTRRLVRADEPWATCRDGVVTALVTGGSAVVVVGGDTDQVARIADSERVYDLMRPARSRLLPCDHAIPAKIGGRTNSMLSDHVMWVRMGASTPPEARRCSATTVPRTTAAKTSTGLPPAIVANA